MIKRKFRFRVWDIDNKCWHRSTQLVIRPYSGTVTDGATTPNVVLSQWTGLKDKNNMKGLMFEVDYIENIIEPPKEVNIQASFSIDAIYGEDG